MPKPILNQVVASASPGDAVWEHAYQLRRWLRDWGFDSNIFAEHVAPALRREVGFMHRYRPRPGERRLIYHHCIGSKLVDDLLALPIPLVLIYHNITPAEFFRDLYPEFAMYMVSGREQLRRMRGRTELALGVSAFNELELRQAGYARTGVLPIALELDQYQLQPDPAVTARLADAGPILLFVGRLVPNKRPEDLIKLLYYYRRIEPRARLVLVGSPPWWLPTYTEWLHRLTRDLGLEGAVHFAGHVSQAELVAYYRRASLYISMSEHEGFGRPLIESMHFGVPVFAYAAAAVPDTLDGAGVLFHAKHFEALAEAVDVLIGDEALRRRLVARQKARSEAFLEPVVRPQWAGWLEALGALPAGVGRDA